MANSTSRYQSSKPLRVAVLGCGKLAREVLLPTLGGIRNVAVVLVADPDAGARATAATLAPGATAVADWRDAIANAVDAVVVALPTAMHAEAAIAVMEAGKHLYLEKPIAATIHEGLRVVERGGSAGLKACLHTSPASMHTSPASMRTSPDGDNRPGDTRVAMVGFNYRFNPLIVELRQRLHDGEVGVPKVIRTTFSTKATPGATWRRPDALGGGVLLDLGSHHIDLIRYIADDEIASVSATRTVSSESAERVALTMQLARGVVVQSVFATGTDDVDRIEIEGERGSLAVDRYRSWVVQHSATGSSSLTRGLRELGGWRYALEKQRAPWHEPSFAHALRAFVAAVRGSEQTGASLEDGLKSLHVIHAAEGSCAEQRTVEVPGATR